MRISVDLDTLRMPEFRLMDMNGGDAAQPPGMMRGLLREYAADWAPLPDPVAGLAVDRARECGTGRPDRSRTLTGRWLPGGDAESGDAESGEANGDEHEGDAGLLRICGALEERSIPVKLWGDGAYDARYVFSLLQSLDISPLARVRTNSNTRSRGVDRARSRAVLDQLGGRGGCTSREPARMTKSERQANQKDWRERVEFGLRWLVGMMISAFKRVFGESVRALKPHTAYVEIATKMAACNHAQDFGDRAVRAVREACSAA